MILPKFTDKVTVFELDNVQRYLLLKTCHAFFLLFSCLIFAPIFHSPLIFSPLPSASLCGVVFFLHPALPLFLWFHFSNLLSLWNHLVCSQPPPAGTCSQVLLNAGFHVEGGPRWTKCSFLLWRKKLSRLACAPTKGLRQDRSRSSGVAACQEELVCHNSPEQTFGLLTCITPQFSYDLILLPGTLFFSLLQ